MKLRILYAAAAATSVLAAANLAHAVTWPGYGLDTGGPSLVITLGPNNAVTLTSTGQPGTYDGSDDTYIGVINNSGGTVNSLHLTSNNDIFGFDGDGIDTYGAPSNSHDSTGYGGPISYFTNITGSASSLPESGTVNFLGGLANGANTYFSLEEALTTASFTGGGGGITRGVPEPATWALMLIGVGAVGSVLRRRTAAAQAAA